MNSPRSLRTRRNAAKATKTVRNPRSLERDLYVEGSFGKASNWATGAGMTESRTLRMDVPSSSSIGPVTLQDISGLSYVWLWLHLQNRLSTRQSML